MYSFTANRILNVAKVFVRAGVEKETFNVQKVGSFNESALTVYDLDDLNVAAFRVAPHGLGVADDGTLVLVDDEGVEYTLEGENDRSGFNIEDFFEFLNDNIDTA